MIEHDVTGEFTQYVAMSERTDKEKEADKGLIVTFDDFPVLDEEHPETIEWITSEGREGRPHYNEKEYILIVAPGDKTNIIHRVWGWPSDVRRFLDRYKLWKADKSASQHRGTPLQAWKKLAPSMIKELQFFHVFTVEQLAAMDDSNIQKFAGLLKYRTMAKDFLAAQEKTAVSTELRSEMDKKDKELEELRARLASLEAKQPATGQPNSNHRK